MARKENKTHYIYKTMCNVTGKFYVGMHSTSNIDDGYLGSGLRLRLSIRKHGVENHTKEILEFLPTREALIVREKEIVTKELISEDLCMNLKEGGDGGFTSEQQKLNAAKSNEKQALLREDPEWVEMKAKNVSEANKKAYDTGIRQKGEFYNWSGKNHSDETKRLMAESSKGMGTGESNSQYGTCWITKDGLNKKVKKEDLEPYLEEGWVKGRK
jgi:hypothetical protein